MLDAVVGAVIMVIATTSLLAAVEVIEKSFADAGRQELSVTEKQILERIDLTVTEQSQFWQDSLRTLPRQVVSSESE